MLDQVRKVWSISRQYLFIHSVVSINRNIVGHNKYVLVITVVVFFVSYTGYDVTWNAKLMSASTDNDIIVTSTGKPCVGTEMTWLDHRRLAAISLTDLCTMPAHMWSYTLWHAKFYGLSSGPFKLLWKHYMAWTTVAQQHKLQNKYHNLLCILHLKWPSSEWQL